jgi:TonB family protein
MKHCKFFLSLVVLLAFSLPGFTQDVLPAQEASPAPEVLPVDAQTLDQHVTHRAPLVYPSAAKTAGIQGTVAFVIQIGTTGKIEKMNVVSSPDMLQQAAMDCLKQWTYAPFVKDGAPIKASGPVFIEFSLGNDAPAAKAAPDATKAEHAPKDRPVRGEEQIAELFGPAAEACRKSLMGTDYKEAFDLCKKAADLAQEFPPDARFIEKRAVFVQAAWASLYAGYMKASLNYASKAVDAVKLGHDDNAGGNAAYSVKGIVEGKFGQLDESDRDLTVAEDYERKAIASLDKDATDESARCKLALVQDLRFHAQILQALNRADEAQKKLDEAATYGGI